MKVPTRVSLRRAAESVTSLPWPAMRTASKRARALLVRQGAGPGGSGSGELDAGQRPGRRAVLPHQPVVTIALFTHERKAVGDAQEAGGLLGREPLVLAAQDSATARRSTTYSRRGFDAPDEPVTVREPDRLRRVPTEASSCLGTQRMWSARKRRASLATAPA